MIVSFTGHRSFPKERNDRLYTAIEQLVAEGCHTFLCGMAEGFDIAAAEAVLQIKANGAPIKLICVIPFHNHRTTLDYNNKLRYDAICIDADQIIFTAQDYYHGVYNLRNDYLVDNADIILCYYSGRIRSGTGYTVARALKNRKRTINIYADGEQIKFFG